MVLEAHVVAASEELTKENTAGSTPQIFSVVDQLLDTFSTFLRSGTTNDDLENDGVLLYATEVLDLGLLYIGFHDAIREGDGERVIVYWKVLMIIFHLTGRRNYAKEAFLLLLQLQTVPERLQQELIWNRFVNTRGLPGKNIPCDLHMEHLNKNDYKKIRGKRYPSFNCPR